MRKFLPLLAVFLLSCVIGANISPTINTVQASPPVNMCPYEFPKVVQDTKSIENIDVTVNIETQEVSVKGAIDAIVNVKTIGEIKPIVKYKTIKQKEIVNKGYPFVKSIVKVNEKPVFSY